MSRSSILHNCSPKKLQVSLALAGRESMVRGYIKLSVTLAMLLASIGVHAESRIKVTLDGTTICYPARFSPDTSFTEVLLAPVKDQLDESHGEQLVYIPATEMAKIVPGYVESHANKYNPAVPHDIRGIVYPKSSFTDPHAMAKKAWNVYRELKEPVIEKDEITGLYKVYHFEKATGPWHFVVSPPERNKKNDFDPSWYVGHCGEIVNSYDCKIDIDYKGIRYQYSVSEYNMALRAKIQDAIKSKIQSWESSCGHS